MFHRREVLNRMTIGAALSAFTTPTHAAGDQSAAQNRSSDLADLEIARAVQGVRDEIAHQSSFWELAAVRDQQRTFLRTNTKFPDYIEVGIDVWQQVYDWHVRFQQPMTLGRTPDARYTIKLMDTTLIMRPDLAPAYIGVPYDNR